MAQASECRDILPQTAVHVLSNGRAFASTEIVDAWTGVQHPSLMVGIPIYSAVDTVHDYVVQAKGAFDETVLGVLKLKDRGQRVEIRVVLHKLTIPRLKYLAEFVAMNLPFVSHVALMGLEITGFTRANLGPLWIDPYDYQRELAEAVEALDRAQIFTSIYNHPLCLLPASLWPFARKSISDWKNIYLAPCAGCAVRERCGGFFKSATSRHSAHIRSLPRG